MRLSSIVAPLACLGALVNAALTTVEFDLVFPRDNVTYAPTTHLPIIFAAKNSQLVQNMEFSFVVQTQHSDGKFYTLVTVFPASWGDSASNETIFFFIVVDVEDLGFDKEGSRPLRVLANWNSCSDGPRGTDLSATGFNQSSPATILFRTAKSGQALNLIDTTDAQCEKVPGFRLAVDDQTKTVPNPTRPGSDANGTHQCVTVMPISPAGSDLVADPCSVKVPADLVEVISLWLDSTACAYNGPCPPASTMMSIISANIMTKTASAAHSSTAQPAATTAATTTTTAAAAATTAAASDPPKNAAGRLAMAGTAWLAAAFGVVVLQLA